MLHTKVEVTGNQLLARAVRGDTSGIRAVMESTHQIAMQEMEDALKEIGAATETAFVDLSPLGKGNPGTEHKGGTTPARSPGTLKASWSHRVERFGDDLVMEVGSSDPVSEYVDKGTGLHATGGVRRKIRPSQKKYLAVPAGHLAIGGSRGSKKKGTPVLDVRYLKSVSGTPARHLVENAQARVRPTVGPILRAAAKRAKRDIKAALKAS